MADRTGCTVLAIMHPNKKSSEFNSVYRITSSLDFVAAARSVLVVGRHPDLDDVRVLAPAKTNLTVPPASLQYKVSDDGTDVGAFTWLGETDLGANDVLQGPTPGEKGALEEAKDFLFEILENGSVLSNDVLDAAKAKGVAEKTLRRAAKVMGVVVFQPKVKTGSRGSPGWVWSLLPDDGSDAQVPREKEMTI